MLRDILQSLDADCMDAMEEVMISWRDRGRTGSSVNIDGTGAVAGDGDGALPLGPSEWEDGLGLPLCVVCQNVRGRRTSLSREDECLRNDYAWVVWAG